jgi:alpha-L-rhamnosidase
VAISEDGIHWKAVAILEDSPISQYSYPSVIQTKDGLVHIVYTWRRQVIKHAVIQLNQIDTKPILKEVWPGIPLDPNAKPSED